MTEEEFCNKIDCNFPYNDKKKWKELIDIWINISVNCIYYIIHELVRIPYSVKVNKGITLELFNYIISKHNDKIIEFIKNTCYLLIEWKENSVNKALEIMEEISKFKWYYIPLNIIYFSCDDIDWKVEEKFNLIISSWEK